MIGWGLVRAAVAKASETKLTSEAFDRRVVDAIISLALSVALGFVLWAHWFPSEEVSAYKTTLLATLLTIALWGKLLYLLSPSQEFDPSHPIRLGGRFACGLLAVALALSGSLSYVLPIAYLAYQAWEGIAALRSLRQDCDLEAQRVLAYETVIREGNAFLNSGGAGKVRGGRE